MLLLCYLCSEKGPIDLTKMLLLTYVPNNYHCSSNPLAYFIKAQLTIVGDPVKVAKTSHNKILGYNFTFLKKSSTCLVAWMMIWIVILEEIFQKWRDVSTEIVNLRSVATTQIFFDGTRSHE